MLVVKLLLLPSVGNQLLDNIKIEKRFPTEKIHLQILPVTGIGNQKIKGLLSGLVGHKCPSSMIFAFLCKAITAGKITVMGDMQAKCLDHGRTFFKVHNAVFIHILCEQFPVLFELLYLIDCFLNLRLRIPVRKCPDNLILRVLLIHSNHIIGDIIHDMDRTGVDI